MTVLTISRFIFMKEQITFLKTFVSDICTVNFLGSHFLLET